MSNKIDTDELMQMLQAGSNEACLSSNDSLFNPASFAEILKEQMMHVGLTGVQLAAASNISKTYIYQLIRGERRPGRDTVLRLSIVLQMTVDETQKWLTISGNSILYPRIRRDASIIFALSKKISFVETEELLFSLSERTLYGNEE